MIVRLSYPENIQWNDIKQSSPYYFRIEEYIT